VDSEELPAEKSSLKTRIENVLVKCTLAEVCI